MINANLINLSTIIQDLLLLLFINLIIKAIALMKKRKFKIINFLAISNMKIFDI